MSAEDKAMEHSSDNAGTDFDEEAASEDGAVDDHKGSGEASDAVIPDSGRMVMYNARLAIAVEDVSKTIRIIENKTNEIKGYIVESSTFEHEKNMSGQMSVRIPSSSLSVFLDEMSSISDKVIQKTIEGQDVTEEYVDLESRLRAKNALESRLLDLLNRAETTEDLLKVSEDLARVQEEIEQLEGRKRYIENRTDFAEVNIEIEDSSVYIPEVTKGEDLQTGSKIKQAFTNSINMIVSLFSGLVVFFVGYSPILIIIAIPAAVLWFIFRKKKSSESHEA